MNRYIDFFLLPLANHEIENYRQIAQQAAAIWMEHGALEYVETVGDDLEPEGTLSFRNAAGAQEGETVIAAYIAYESREHRDAVNAKVMEDPRIQEICAPGKAPFDCKRMAFGGFRAIVEA